MQAYLIQILTMSLLCGLLEILTPAGEREGLRRAVRLVTALCLLGLMIAPLRGIRGAVASWDLGGWAREMEDASREEYEELMREKLTAVTAAQWEAALYDLLADDFGVARGDCTVSVEWSENSDTLTARRVWISLRGRALLRDPREIEAAVSEAAGCPCTVSAG